ncbi:hypothetical protein [Falsiroseomonas sp.]|uniref:hypothetical protein n=1 Tax=Falsiroseomonas sp. TaxID=2870721 RepID=UPI003F72E242
MIIAQTMKLARWTVPRRRPDLNRRDRYRLFAWPPMGKPLEKSISASRAAAWQPLVAVCSADQAEACVASEGLKNLVRALARLAAYEAFAAATVEPTDKAGPQPADAA